MALPALATAIIGMAAPKVIGAIGQRNNWDPKLTSFLSLAAGFGAGAAGAGAFSGGASSFGALAPASSGFSGAVGGGGMGAAAITSPLASQGASWAPYAFRSAQAPSNIMSSSDPGVSSALQGMGYSAPEGSLSSIVTPSNVPSTLDKLKGYATSPDGQKYITAAAGQFMDGMFAQKPAPRSRGGGGGGGGGGPRAPAYPGGGGSGQKQVVWNFPQSGANPQLVN